MRRIIRFGLVTAFVPLGHIAVGPTPAIAACAVTGTGTIGALDGGDSVSCTGLNLNHNIQDSAAGSNNIAITIGDGSTPTSLTPAAGVPVVMNNAPGMHLTVTNQGTIVAPAGQQAIVLYGAGNAGNNDNSIITVNAGGSITGNFANYAIQVIGASNNAVTGFQLNMNGSLTGNTGFNAYYMTDSSIQIGGTVNAYSGVLLATGSNNNTVVLANGGLIQQTAANAGGINFISGASNNTITVAGTINLTGNATFGLFTFSGATGNQFTIQSTGVVRATGIGGYGVYLGDGGNFVDNAGTIVGGNKGIIGSAGTDTVINSGSITGNAGTAIDLAGGADSLTLKTGSSITGAIDLGTGTDTLKFQGNGTLSSNVAGAESVIMNGGLWTMAGNMTGGGTIDVQAGKFVLNGNAGAYDVTVQSGAAFGGTGTSQSLTANSGGIIAPGNSIGTTNTGNVTFNAGSIYQVEVASNGTSDLIKATGTATINGGTVQVTPLGTGFQANTQYTILTATGGVTGTFNTLALNFPLLTGVLTYDPNNVYFKLQQTAGFSTLKLTPNQFAAANALDQAALAGVSGPLSTATNKLAVNNTAGVQAGLDDLAGQILADSRRFTVDQAAGFHRFVWGAGINASSEVMRVSTSPASVSSYAAGPYDPIGGHLKAPREAASPSVWFGTYGNWDRVSSTSIAFGTNTAVGGAALGVDIWRTPTFVIGAAAGASTGKLKSAGRPNSVDANAGHGAVYARGDVGAFSVNAAVSYAFAALDTSRSISFLNQTATSSSNAQTLGASLGVSTIVDLAGIKVEPFANLDWFSSHQNGFAETGAPGVNQLVRSGSYDLLQGTAGARFRHRTALSDGRAFDVSATLAVRQDFIGRAAGMTTAFEGAPGIPLVITGVEHNRTAAILGGQIGYTITRNTSLNAGYEAELAPGRNRHALQGSVRTRF